MNAACPYCRAAFGPEDEVTACPACATPHHRDCFAENHGCTVFGCSQAPQDEPKISVSTEDVASRGQPTVPAFVPHSFLNLQSPPQPANAPVGAAPPPPPVSSATPPPPVPGNAGAPQAPWPSQGPAPYTMPTNHPWYDYVPRKSRVVYVLVAVFFGAFGAHNFYAGYAKKGTIQLCITVFTCFWGSIISWIWAIVEACIVTQDDDGVAFI